MKANINNLGELIIVGESELEHYALQQWRIQHQNIAKELCGTSSKDLVIPTYYEDKGDINES